MVEETEKQELSGATVLRSSILGYGARGVWHASHLMDFPEDMPVVIEIAEIKGKIDTLLPAVDEMVRKECQVIREKRRSTVHKIKGIRYRCNETRP